MTKVKSHNGRTIELLLDGKAVMEVYREESGRMGHSEPVLEAVIVGEDKGDCITKYIQALGIDIDPYEAFQERMSQWRFFRLYDERVADSERP